jgi:thioredoxin 1
VKALRRTTWRRAALAALALLGGASAPATAQRLYDPSVNAAAAIDSALAAAKVDGKLVLLDFGADWCLDCVVLDRLFHDPFVQRYLADRYHVVRIDVGQFDRNLDISRRYGDPIKGGVPAAVVLTGSGRLLVSTTDGALESARAMNAAEILRLLEGWAASGR